MKDKIRVAIADDHQAIIDGYSYRLEHQSDIEIVATTSYGEKIEQIVVQHKVNVLLLDVQMPTSPENLNSFPILFLIPRILRVNPNLAILVISMHNQHTLIRAVMDAGASGYLLKEDQSAITELASIVRTLARGGVYLSQQAFQIISNHKNDDMHLPLTSRQVEAISLCAAYPDSSTTDLAIKMSIESSTMRTMLSNAYLKLGVRTRAAAVDKARRSHLLIDIDDQNDFISKLQNSEN